jgi:hypothetical protein
MGGNERYGLRFSPEHYRFRAEQVHLPRHAVDATGNASCTNRFAGSVRVIAELPAVPAIARIGVCGAALPAE